MASWIGSRFFWGGLILAAGVILLLESLNIIDFGSLLWALLFFLGGLIFISVFASNKENWWAIIPSFALFGIGILIGLEYLVPDFPDEIGGSIVLASIGLSFLVVYLVDHNNWWAIIPFGVLTAIAVAVGLEPYVSETAFVGIFFLGMGITFAVVALIPTSQGNLGWAWIPAGILAVIGLVFMVISGDIFRVVGALALIILGAYFIYRTLRAS